MQLQSNNAGMFPGVDSLAELNAGHELLTRRVERMAREVGEAFAMQAAMGRVLLGLCAQHGSYDRWRKMDPRELRFCRSTAHNYMRIAKLEPHELASATGYRMLGLLPPGESSSGEANEPPTPVGRMLGWIGKVRVAILQCGQETFRSAQEARRFLEETEEIVALRAKARELASR